MCRAIVSIASSGRNNWDNCSTFVHSLGVTWKGGLLLDERESSYSDGTQPEDGTLFIIYDHQRYTLNRAGKRGVGSVQIAVFSEEDVRAGKPVSDEARLKVDVTRVTEGTMKSSVD